MNISTTKGFNQAFFFILLQYKYLNRKALEDELKTLRPINRGLTVTSPPKLERLQIQNEVNTVGMVDDF